MLIMSQRRAGDWTCPICKFNVFASKNECRKCHTNKPSGAIEKPMRPGDWICKGCNFRLFANKTHCFKCNLDKLGQPVNDNIVDDKLCGICMNNEKNTGFLRI